MHKGITVIVLLMTIGISFLSYKVFISYTIQMDLLYDINNGTFNYIENSEKIPTSFPEIGVTSMNLKTIKSSYLMKKQEYDSALYLLNKVNYDPLGMTDVKKAEVYFAKNKFDSLFKYSNLAYDKLPNNSAHVIWRLKALSTFNKYSEILKMFNSIKKYGQETDTYFYFATVLNFYDNYKTDIIVSQAKEAKLKFNTSTYEPLLLVLNFIIFGEENFKKYLKLNEEASIFYSKKDYRKSKSVYYQMLDLNINNSDVNYNIMVCNFYLQKYNQVIKHYFELTSEENDKTGRFEFLLARAYLKNGENDFACRYFKTAKKLGKEDIDSYINNTCYN